MMSAINVKYFCCWPEREWLAEVRQTLKSRSQPFVLRPSISTCVTGRCSCAAVERLMRDQSKLKGSLSVKHTAHFKDLVQKKGCKISY